MKNEGDYLWDKSGEPDPEIRQLEEILGTLRYQPRPLEIPVDLQPDSKPRNFLGFTPRLVPGLAIAATIAIFLLGLGLWLGLQRLQRVQPREVAKDVETQSSPVPVPPRSPDENQNDSVAIKPSGPEEKRNEKRDRNQLNVPLLAENTNRSRHKTHKVEDPQLAENELRAGKAAKDQLVLALRLASAKLNFAQKKTQNTSPRDEVHNQHKIG